ncbi:MAG: ferritin-like domain-containing protein [Acidimicrobiia bacterium]
MKKIYSDWLRRELRDINADQKSMQKTWTETLKRIFDPKSEATATDKQALLGLPGRRGFMRLGGATILGATLLAACGDDDDDEAAPEDEGDATTTTAGGGGMDVTLAKTAASVEALAVSTYMTAADSGKVTNPTVGAAAAMFMDHHQQHQDALNGVITGAGGEAITEPNAAVKAAIVDPVVMDPALDEAKIVKLAYDLESAASQTYSFAATQLSTPELRSTIMTIGGIEARHAAVIGQLALMLGPNMLFPAAFGKAENPLPPDALIQ